MTTGAWVFIETLAALHGSKTEFVAYLNGKYAAWGISKNEAKECRLSLEYIQSHGNAQKHSATFSAVDARNLNNHFKVLEKVLVLLVKECIVMKGSKP
jgi:hypothetical protein